MTKPRRRALKPAPRKHRRRYQAKPRPQAGPKPWWEQLAWAVQMIVLTLLVMQWFCCIFCTFATNDYTRIRQAGTLSLAASALLGVHLIFWNFPHYSKRRHTGPVWLAVALTYLLIVIIG